MAKKSLLTFLLLLILNNPAWAVLTIDTFDGQSTGFSSCSSDTISVTLGGTADFLVVGGSGVNGTTAQAQYSTVTHNGAALTKKADESSGNQEWPSLWTKATPTTGTHDIVVTPVGTCDSCITGYISFIGADATSPEATGENSGNSSSMSVSVTTVTNGAYVVDAMAHHQYNDDIFADASQTEIFNGAGWFRFGSSYELKATAGAVSMDWTNSVSNSWASVGVAIKPAGGGGGGGRTRRFF